MTTRKSDKVYASKDEFEAWVEAIDGHSLRLPSYRDSEVEFKVEVTPTVHAWISGRAIFRNENDERYYGRAEDFNEVRFSCWIWENVSLHGKGSRSDAVEAEVREIFSYLSNDIGTR
jgi:hypothetical protein